MARAETAAVAAPRPMPVPPAPACVRVFEHGEPLDHELVLAGEHGGKIETLARELALAEQWLRDGIDPPTRVLFSGPSGTGKTLTTRWIARKLRMACAVVDLGSILGMHIGESAGNVSSVFGYASARECVLLLDEIESIAARRENLSGSGADQERALVTTTFFQGLDALPPARIVIAATNYADKLDPALYRRFPERIEFVPPAVDERRRILEGILHAPKIPEDWKATVVDRLLEDEDAAQLSGAELRAHAMRMVRRMVGTRPGAIERPAPVLESKKRELEIQAKRASREDRGLPGRRSSRPPPNRKPIAKPS